MRLYAPAVSAALASCLFFASPISAEDWAGAYGALGLSRSVGDVTENVNGDPTYSYGLDGNQPGLNLGYNFQRGTLVYGGELSLNTRTVANSDLYPDLNNLTNVVDMKARAGYASGRFLWYGVFAVSRADAYFAGVSEDLEPLDANGTAYGLGVDMRLNDRVFVGAEILRRHFNIGEGEIEEFPMYSVDFDYTSVGLRVGMTF